MLKAKVHAPQQLPLLERAAREAGVTLDLSADGLHWSRYDLVLVGPQAPLLQALPECGDLWTPAVVGLGAPPNHAAEIWCWAWLQEPDPSHELALLLPRALREGRLRRAMRQALAHDLRSPLGVMTGYCELLEEELLGDLGEKQLRAVATIASQAGRLLEGLETLASKVAAPKA